MAQSTITNFFTNRKRPATEDLKTRNKVMILESDVASLGYTPKQPASELRETPALQTTRLKLETKMIFSSDPVEEMQKPKQIAAAPSPALIKTKAAQKAPIKASRKVNKPREANQPDMKAFLKSKEDIKTEIKKEVEGAPPTMPEQVNVLFEMKGSLSPRKKGCEPSAPPAAREEIVQSTTPDNSATRKENNVLKARKELSLGDIKSCLTRSSRIAELRASLARIERGREKLAQIEKVNQQPEQPPKDNGDKPQLNQFQSIELEVPASPSKSPMKSPQKFLSPRKIMGASPVKAPAYQRYLSLTDSGLPALALPYGYRHLAELFRCVDTVLSLLHNRNEVITFQKLQPAVQEMSRKTFTERHLAQMLAVFPEMCTVKQEKLRTYGTSIKQDKFCLVLTPTVKSTSDKESEKPASMTPSVLLERRRQFYNHLLDMAKKHHEDFLQTLEPPIVVAKEKLTRWHPEFPVDMVPDITPVDLPRPPNDDKCCSAKDVLAKSRQLYACNARMERALESVARSQESRSAETQGRSVQVQVVDAQPPVKIPPTSPFKNMQLGSALKGIPKALLEKVRARQAAKAMEAMTRSPAQDKEAVQYTRLPEIARILRNTFVAEKKGAMPLEIVLEKVGNSYRTTMSQSELEEHLRLLAKAVPGWLSFEHLLKTDYVKLSKGGDMNRVMKKLESLAEQKCGFKA